MLITKSVNLNLAADSVWWNWRSEHTMHGALNTVGKNNKLHSLTNSYEMNLVILINSWLDINYQVTTKHATVPKHKLFHQLNTPSYLEAPDKRRRTKGEPERTVYARLPAPGVRPTRPTDSWNLISSLVSFGKAHSTQKKMDKFPPHRREPSKKNLTDIWVFDKHKADIFGISIDIWVKRKG